MLSVTSAHAAQATLPAPPPPTFLTSTTNDIGRPYTLINGACVYQEFPKFAMKGDPLEQALSAAFKRMQDIAASAGANALIGFDVDFQSPVSSGQEGRLLLCGTLVKLR